MSCPRTFGLRILSRKWSYFVLRALRTPRTFSDIKRELRYVTNHVLSHELKLLQEEHLISDTGDRYSRTPAAEELLQLVEPLYWWSLKHQKLQPCSPAQDCAHCERFADDMKPKADRFIELQRA